ncbi:hypothetical protein Hanom_Chr13g01204781 [Helianthus anomalus]
MKRSQLFSHSLAPFYRLVSNGKAGRFKRKIWGSNGSISGRVISVRLFGIRTKVRGSRPRAGGGEGIFSGGGATGLGGVGGTGGNGGDCGGDDGGVGVGGGDCGGSGGKPGGG